MNWWFWCFVDGKDDKLLKCVRYIMHQCVFLLATFFALSCVLTGSSSSCAPAAEEAGAASTSPTEIRQSSNYKTKLALNLNNLLHIHKILKVRTFQISCSKVLKKTKYCNWTAQSLSNRQPNLWEYGKPKPDQGKPTWTTWEHFQKKTEDLWGREKHALMVM